MPSEKAVVHVIDDDEAMRQSLAFLLGATGMEVQTYDSAVEFLKVAPTLKAGCVITDVRMPELSGIELLRRLRELKVGVPVIVITGHGDVPLAVKAMKAGAVDFIEKPFSDDVILASLEAATRGREAKRAGAANDVVGQRIARLTPREIEVFQQLILGHPNKVIAYHLNISARTVEIHRARVMEKMEARSLPELVRMAIEGGVEMRD